MNDKETQLQHGITRLRTRLLVMCATVGIAVDDACSALATGNMGRAGAVIDGEMAVNALETEIDEMALTLLVRHQPVAQDLRFIVAALRIVIDLERIGDEAVNIAERAIIVHERLPEPVLSVVSPLMAAASVGYKKSVEALRLGDGAKALDLCRSDDENTQIEVQALHRIVDYFCSNGGKAQGNQAYIGMNGILICRSLNRICRRSANIAEQTYFIAEGANIKHAPAHRPVQADSPC
ncbi:MAG: phosphate signaling complex protein PhoU [Desulfovibrio sp.]|jgi:phosphate transport system protein|nr:phosphate signaling complex protein PhoU [Desulfovibrio sp.]